jgi:two-component system sensor histidine kinase/response regulator
MMSSAPAFAEDFRTNHYRIFRRMTKPVCRSVLWDCLRGALRGEPRDPDVSIFKPENSAGPSRRILLVEDNEVNHRLATKLLQRMGHRVQVALNGAEAYGLLQEQNYDLVLMDLQMPVMGGLEATRKIRERERGGGAHVPIVAMTAHAASEDRRQCEEAGMDGYLSKPVRPELLRQEIQRVTGGDASARPPEEPGERPSRGDWDLDELLERLDGDQEFLRELLEIFRQDGRANLEKARSQMAQGDLSELSRTAHTLKGMLKNLAMGSAAKTAAALEKAAGDAQTEQSQELLGQLEKELAGILPEVEAQLAGVKS